LGCFERSLVENFEIFPPSTSCSQFGCGTPVLVQHRFERHTRSKDSATSGMFVCTSWNFLCRQPSNMQWWCLAAVTPSSWRKLAMIRGGMLWSFQDAQAENRGQADVYPCIWRRLGQPTQSHVRP
jgi:hypothetical protein